MPDAPHRRTYLVDRSFQLKYILLLMGWGFALALLFGLWAYQAHAQAVELVAPDPGQRAWGRAGVQLLWVLAAIAVLSSAALGLLGFVMTHRVAGPIHVMGELLGALAEGRYPSRRSLRKHDELKVFHGQLLQVIETLRERERLQLARLDDAVGRMRAAAARAPELGPTVAALEAELRERRGVLDEPTGATPLPLPVPARAAGERR
jgi:hypothetical protein